LKLDWRHFTAYWLKIAPITGARIETTERAHHLYGTPYIAPITGARIETGSRRSRWPTAPIAPITGARIETVRAAYPCPYCPDRPHHGGAD